MVQWNIFNLSFGFRYRKGTTEYTAGIRSHGYRGGRQGRNKIHEDKKNIYRLIDGWMLG